MNRIRTVFNKELLDNLRDRRSLLSALLYPLLGPAILIGIFFAIANVISDQTEKPLDLPVIGAENAPNLMEFLRQSNVVIQPGPADPEAKVREGDLDVVLIVPKEYGAALSAGEPAPVRLVLDESRQSASSSIDRVRNLLSAFSNQIGRLRLAARGVSPLAIDVLAIETVDLATPQSQVANLLNLVPYFIIFSIFMGGMYLAIDSTAGEKERGSLEPLLTTPATHAQLVLGKMSATLVFTVIAVIETVIGFIFGVNFLPLEEMIGVKISLTPQLALGIVALTLPMMLLATALQMIVATATKGTKEAQTYLGFLPLIPAMPGMFLAFFPVKPAWWNMAIPTFGQQILINRLMRGEVIDPSFVAANTLVTLVVALLLVWVAIRLYGRERLVLVK
ncbi:MAG: ABC transporter permease [Caldilineaceae bacterium]